MSTWAVAGSMAISLVSSGVITPSRRSFGAKMKYLSKPLKSGVVSSSLTTCTKGR
ncbi:MAG: hypothetical protein IPG50_20675 [Myxococcales bacterium]|nr:hypothetical protein [Myxococcales bacterium]